MLKRLRAKHPVGFCVLSEVLFLGSLLLSSYLIVFALVLFGVDLERVDSYFLSAVQEAVGMVVALVILGRTGKMYLLRRRGSGFFNGLLVGMYPLVLIGYSLYTKLMFGMPEDGQLQPAFSIFSFFLSMALVGVAEEFIFRGVIAQSLLERFGTGRAPCGHIGLHGAFLSVRLSGHTVVSTRGAPPAISSAVRGRAGAAGAFRRSLATASISLMRFS